MAFRKHFRFNKLVKHPAYIFKEEKEYYYFFYVTHQKDWRYSNNIPLTGTVKRGDCKKRNYIVPYILKARKDKFMDQPANELKFHKQDGPIIREFLKHAEERWYHEN